MGNKIIATCTKHQGGSRKVGSPPDRNGQKTFGSDGETFGDSATLTIEYEVPPELFTNPQAVVAKWRELQTLCELAVDEQLARRAEQRAKAGQVVKPASTSRSAADDFDEFGDDTAPGDRGHVERPAAAARRDERRPVDPRVSYADDDDDDYREPAGDGNGNGKTYNKVAWPPSNGKSLYGWAKENQEMQFFITLGKQKGFPVKISQWSEDKVSWACRRFERERPSAVRNGRH